MSLGNMKKRSKQFVPPKLMLTSMMDMFTIILIFLLFSFSENPETIRLDKDLELPHSSAELGYDKALKMILSKKELRLNDEVLAEIRDHRVVGLTPEDPAASSLYQRLKAHREEQKAGAPEASSPEAAHIVFLCDRTHSFKTINTVIKTAARAGYPNFQFAVLEE